MTEALSSFVARRRPEWDALSALLERRRSNALHLEELERLDQLYRTATRDLAHAQAHFPGSDLVRFLNQLCVSGYGAIYQPPKDRLAALRRFYAHELPRTLRENARYVLASALIFVLGAVAGALAIFWAPGAAELLVPDGVRHAVEERRMWTEDLFSVTPPGMASTWIATNNLTVTITAFALGIAFGLGSMLVLLNNGLHIGAVAALCAREDMGVELLGFISAHGPVELSIIAIAGGAGLMLGHALIAPGELPRGQALRHNGREAVKLVVGLAPFLAAIALVEGFVSPSQLPLWFKATLGLALAAALWGYLWRGAPSPKRAPGD